MGIIFKREKAKIEFNYVPAIEKCLNTLAKIHDKEMENLKQIQVEARWVSDILDLIDKAEGLLYKIKSGRGGREEAKKIHELFEEILAYLSEEHKVERDLNLITERFSRVIYTLSNEMEKAFKYLK